MAQAPTTPAPEMPGPETLPASLTSSNNLPMAIVPKTISEVQVLAAMVAAGGWAPKSYRANNQETGAIDQAKVALGIMHGMEVGLKPLQSLQNIAVINGMPSIYGDAALGLCRASGLIEDFKEEEIIGSYEAEGETRGSTVKVENAVIGYRCTVKRKDMPTPTVQTFTMDDARRANLLGKQGPWQNYRKRMFQMRARSFALRDACPEVMKGLVLVEEAIDMGVAVDATPPATGGVRTARTAAGKLDAFAEEERVVDAEFEDATDEEITTQEENSEVETAETETVADEDGVVVEDFPVPPSAVYEAFEARQFGPFIDWLVLTMEPLDAGARQALADAYGDKLHVIAKASPKNLGVVANMAAKMGFEVTFPGDGQDG